MEYYAISDDVYYPGILYFGTIEEMENDWHLVIPELYGGPPQHALTSFVKHWPPDPEYAEPDYIEAGYASIPFISERAMNVLLQLPDIESQLDFLPLTIREPRPQTRYFIMVVKLRADCVDESQSEWVPASFDEGETPTSRGFLRKYSAFYKLVIDPARTGDLDILQIEGSGPMIVSQRFKDLWQGHGFLGMVFDQGVDHLNL